MAKIRQKNSLTGCWIWTAYRDADGLPRFRSNWARRYSYLTFVGPIPPGRWVIPVCGSPGCVAPGHLVPVEPRAAVLRRDCPPARNAAKVVCYRSHPLTGENVVREGLSRVCLECRRLRWGLSGFFWTFARKLSRISSAP